jgi:hypothetical protein
MNGQVKKTFISRAWLSALGKKKFSFAGGKLKNGKNYDGRSKNRGSGGS